MAYKLSDVLTGKYKLVHVGGEIVDYALVVTQGVMTFEECIEHVDDMHENEAQLPRTALFISTKIPGKLIPEIYDGTREILEYRFDDLRFVLGVR